MADEIQGELLTPEEHDVIDDAGRLYSKVEKLIGGGKHEAADLTEIRHHVHAIQYAIMANAAARAYPDRYRLRGQAGEYEAL